MSKIKDAFISRLKPGRIPAYFPNIMEKYYNYENTVT